LLAITKEELEEFVTKSNRTFIFPPVMTGAIKRVSGLARSAIYLIKYGGLIKPDILLITLCLAI
jgi:hypothetical protein